MSRYLVTGDIDHEPRKLLRSSSGETWIEANGATQAAEVVARASLEDAHLGVLDGPHRVKRDDCPACVSVYWQAEAYGRREGKRATLRLRVYANLEDPS